MTAIESFPKSVPDIGHYEGEDAPWPAELRLFREEGRLEIDFADGSSYSLPAEYLRVESPSADVRTSTSWPSATRVRGSGLSPSSRTWPSRIHCLRRLRE